MTATEKDLFTQLRDLRERVAALETELAKLRPAKRKLPATVREAGRRRIARALSSEGIQAAADDICASPVDVQRMIDAGDPLIPSDIRNALGGAL